jgi:hypothetical protein
MRFALRRFCVSSGAPKARRYEGKGNGEGLPQSSSGRRERRRNNGEWRVVEIFGTAGLLARHDVGKSPAGVLRGVLFCNQANSWKLKI